MDSSIVFDLALIEKYPTWRCDEEHMALGADNLIYMHPLPADRGREVTDYMDWGLQLGRRFRALTLVLDDLAVDEHPWLEFPGGGEAVLYGHPDQYANRDRNGDRRRAAGPGPGHG